MFKKLKDKIAEEVKSSPQRIQQLTQAVSEKIHTATSDDSFFSIGEDDEPSSNVTPEPGFSNVSLSNYSTPQSARVRKNSNSSVASDMSFLPRYESATNLYHLQSDLDASASEVEDNASSSSQLGHLSKEQIYAAFQKAQMRYHKYRGRYTDIANHYRELERENGKMKSVLVETQDKALRRVAELREQCSLEQKAKAHLENALRLDIDEKQYIIDTLKTKVDLLQNKNPDELLVNVEEVPEKSAPKSETLAKDLKDAQSEIENLNERLQECKANAIVFNSKESDFKGKIRELEEVIKQKSIEIADVLERERENNLIIAQTKMELHTEIQNRDLEIENLKQDVDALKVDLEQYENKSKSTKLDNLQSQNTKLIEKIESLSLKCKNYESELLKLEQIKIENENKIEEIKELGERHRKEIEAQRDGTKQHLLTLEAKITESVRDEFKTKEESLQADFEEKLRQLAANTCNFQEIQVKLLQKEDELESLTAKLEELTESLRTRKDKYEELETSHLELIDENAENAKQLRDVSKELEQVKEKSSKHKRETNKLEEELEIVRSKLESLQRKCVEMETVLSDEQHSKVRLEADKDELKRRIAQLEKSRSDLQAELSGALTAKEEAENKLVQVENAKILELEERVKELDAKLEQDHVADNNVKEELAKAFQEKLKEQKTQFHSEIQNLNGEVLAFKEQNDVIQSCIDVYKQKLNAYETSSAQKSEQLRKLSQENENIKREIERLSQNLTEKGEEVAGAKAELQRLTEENVKLACDNAERARQIESEYKEQISTLENYGTEFKNERIKLVEENAQLINNNEELQTQISRLKATENERAKLVEEKQLLEQEVLCHKSNLAELRDVHESSRAQTNAINLKLKELSEENRRLLDREDSHQQSLEEMAQLQHRNKQLTTDYDHVTEENKGLLREVAATKLELDELAVQKEKWESVELENAKLQNDLAQVISQLGDKQEVDQFVSENKKLKAQLRTFEERCENYDEGNKLLARQVRELEHQYTELVHERQLLQDEIQELKISPINVNNNSSNDNNKLDQMDDFKTMQVEHEKEVNHLNEKIVQYKSLDLTNRTSIQFYENELQKLKNKNEKLNRKLDETLVTLNHCTELTSSTETEYLRNVLYNYMLGKEGLVLARVIAAVCKFDDDQTEAILQREQQKQTLLGQLGFR